MGIVSTAAYVFIQLLKVLLLVRILTSWFRPRYRTRANGWFYNIDELVWRLTEPFLAPIRKILPTGGMGIDFSVLILWLLVGFVGGFLINALKGMGL